MYYDDFLAAVKQMKRDAEINPERLHYPRAGICYNLWRGYKLEHARHVVIELARGWAGASNDPFHPIKEDTSLGPWEGANLRHRLALLHHILLQLENGGYIHILVNERETT